MTAPEGAYWSAIDAETDGHEGAYYVWTRAQLDSALGAEDAEFLAPVLGFADEPFFEGGSYVLHLPRPLEVQARERRTSRDALVAEIAPLRARLLEARSRRKRPATDDKILADWNGTAIAGLAVAGRALGAPELVERAGHAAGFLLEALRGPDGTLRHAWRAGEARVPAFLADYAFLVRGLLRLHEAGGGDRWLQAALELQAEQARRLGSERGGYFNAAESEELLSRSKELFDGALPAANGVAALNLLDLHRATGDARWLDEAERTLRAFAPIVETHPDGARTAALALARLARARPVAAPPARRESAPDPSGATARGVIEAIRLERTGGADPRGFEPFLLRLRIRDGWHLAVESGLPRLEPAGAELERIEWPTARPLGDEPPLPAFEGALEVRGRIRLDAPRASLVLRFVACGEGRCLPPAELEIAVSA
jgi:uncharacterized protein YyaL (SSP411 family)